MTKSVTPGQQVVKIVHDALIDVLAGEGEPGALKIDNPPAPILMVGLQGSGKTTTTAKLAKRLKERERQARADGLARHQPPGGDGAAADPRRPDRRRHPADREGRDRRPDRQARQDPGEPRRLRRLHARHRRPPAHRRSADGRGPGRPRRRQPARDAAGGRRPDRPGRGERRAPNSTARSASPASC